MENVYLFTDGACSGNPGPGGWCAILQYKGKEKVLSGSERETTNNRMELTGVIEGLKALKRKCSVVVTTDSKYICDAVNLRWLNAWKAKNWKKADGKPVLNRDLWEEIDAMISMHHVTFIWIKGHAGHPENERCDQIAVNEYGKYL